jgi:hypothetical protein
MVDFGPQRMTNLDRSVNHHFGHLFGDATSILIVGVISDYLGGGARAEE